MKLKEINSLVELFFKKYEEKTFNDFEKSKELFLTSLKNKNQPDTLSGPYTYSWGNIQAKIKVLTNYLKKSSTKLFISLNSIVWWAKRESNSHFLRNTILSRARLPVPPFALNYLIIY